MRVLVIDENEIRAIDDALIEMWRLFPIGTCPPHVERLARKIYGVLLGVLERDPRYAGLKDLITPIGRETG